MAITELSSLQLLSKGQCLPSDQHQDFQSFAEGTTLPGATVEMFNGFCISQFLITVTRVWQSPAQAKEKKKIASSHCCPGLSLWLFDPVCQQSFITLGTWEKEDIHVMGGRQQRLRRTGTKHNLQKRASNDLSPKYILLPNVSRTSSAGDELFSHMILWGHLLYLNHNKVHSMSLTVHPQGTHTFSLAFWKPRSLCFSCCFVLFLQLISIVDFADLKC